MKIFTLIKYTGGTVELYITFFIIIASIFLVPIILKRFNIPGITAIMLAGILIGPYGLGIVNIDELKHFPPLEPYFLCSWQEWR